jgi:hypothetical protein
MDGMKAIIWRELFAKRETGGGIDGGHQRLIKRKGRLVNVS